MFCILWGSGSENIAETDASWSLLSMLHCCTQFLKGSDLWNTFQNLSPSVLPKSVLGTGGKK